MKQNKKILVLVPVTKSYRNQNRIKRRPKCFFSDMGRRNTILETWTTKAQIIEQMAKDAIASLLDSVGEAVAPKLKLFMENL